MVRIHRGGTTDGPRRTASSVSEDGPSSSEGLSTGVLIGIILPIISITVGLIGIAVKIYFAKRKKTKTMQDDSFEYRESSPYYRR
ncbi:hypothetical protein CC79DRAFT_1374194 [Sarocladium strictum]